MTTTRRRCSAGWQSLLVFLGALAACTSTFMPEVERFDGEQVEAALAGQQQTAEGDHLRVFTTWLTTDGRNMKIRGEVPEPPHWAKGSRPGR